MYRLLYGNYPFSRHSIISSNERNSNEKKMIDVFKDILFNNVELNCEINETSKLCLDIVSGLLVKDFKKRLSISNSIFDKWQIDRY